MSKIKVQPIIHVPSFKTYVASRLYLQQKIEGLGLTASMGMLDSWYYFTDMEGWGTILYDLVFKSSLYKKERRDCDWYAFKAFVECQDRYELNALAFVIGDIPQGRHAFNMFYYGDGFMLWEPNDGFAWSGEPFEIGENGYQPDLVLI